MAQDILFKGYTVYAHPVSFHQQTIPSSTLNILYCHIEFGGRQKHINRRRRPPSGVLLCPVPSLFTAPSRVQGWAAQIESFCLVTKGQGRINTVVPMVMVLYVFLLDRTLSFSLSRYLSLSLSHTLTRSQTRAHTGDQEDGG